MTYGIRVEIDHGVVRWLRGWDGDRPVFITNKEFRACRGIQEYAECSRAMADAQKVKAYQKFRSVKVVGLR